MDRIEKVSRYIPVVTPSRSGRGQENGSSVRHMLLSIPRIKWLENEETEYYHKYAALTEEPVVVAPSHSDKWCEMVKAEPLTERELLVERLVNDGFSHAVIAEKEHMARATIALLIKRARVKRAYQSLKK
jgi:ATP/maltotriose-dependent transcriptional regulator MalT